MVVTLLFWATPALAGAFFGRKALVLTLTAIVWVWRMLTDLNANLIRIAAFLSKEK